MNNNLRITTNLVAYELARLAGAKCTSMVLMMQFDAIHNRHCFSWFTSGKRFDFSVPIDAMLLSLKDFEQYLEVPIELYQSNSATDYNGHVPPRPESGVDWVYLEISR